MSIFSSATIFARRETLNTDYIPERLVGRDVEIRQVASIFAPILDGYTPYNGFIFGKTGVGKTATVKYVLLELEREVEKKQIPLKYVFVNCNLFHTTTKVLKRICDVVTPQVELPAAGIATSEYYQVLWKAINEFKGRVIVILDEIDKLDEDNILYNISRARENLDVIHGSINVIGISNDLAYKETLDARTQSSLRDLRFVFAPYDAHQLRDILEDRAKDGFKKGMLTDEVIPLCAALAAQEHGDARKALMLLEYAGAIAEERAMLLDYTASPHDNNNKITEDDVREAQKRLESDEIVETIKTLPPHQKVVLQAIIESDKELGTNEIFERYTVLCRRTDMKPLGKTSVSNIIQGLDMQGLINAGTVYRGRHGRKRLIRLNVPKNKIEELLTVEQVS